MRKIIVLILSGCLSLIVKAQSPIPTYIVGDTTILAAYTGTNTLAAVKDTGVTGGMYLYDATGTYHPDGTPTFVTSVKGGIWLHITPANGGFPSGNAWLINGNSGIANNNFLGTIDGATLFLRVNNLPAGFIQDNSVGNGNTAYGSLSLSDTTGFNNTAIGGAVLRANSGGFENTAIGTGALGNNTSGNGNTSIGDYSSQTNTTGTLNTVIGYTADVASNSTTNAIAIGTNAIASSNQLAISDNVTSMYFKNLDSSIDIAPNVVSIAPDGNWHRYSAFNQRFGYPNEDVLGLTDRAVDMQNFNFTLYNSNTYDVEADNGTKYAAISGGTNLIVLGDPEPDAQLGAALNSNDYSIFHVTHDNFIFQKGGDTNYFLISPLPLAFNQNYYLPLSVTDGFGTHYANSNGNIQINPFQNIIDTSNIAVAATISALPAVTYNNGTGGVGATLTADANGALPVIDGVSLSVGSKLLVKNQTSQEQNGFYIVTQLGDGSNPFILTRADNADQTGELYPELIAVSSGTVNGGFIFQQTTVSPVVGVDNLIYVLFFVTQSGVQSVTGLNTDNTDPQNPIVKISVDGITIVGDGTPGSPLAAVGVGGSGVTSVGANDITNFATASVANPTTNAVISYNLINTGSHTLWGRASGIGAPSYLSSIDSTFIPDLHKELYYNTKYSPIWTLTTTGTSGAATYSGNVLNIPNYSSAGAFWPLASGALSGILTGQDTIFSNVPNQLHFKGAFTTTANNQYWGEESPTITFRATSSDVAIAYQLAPTFSYSAIAQQGIALDIPATYTTNGFNVNKYAIRHAGDIIPATTAAWNLGSVQASLVYNSVAANIWYGTQVNTNGVNAWKIVQNTLTPVQLTALGNLKLGTIVTTTDSVYKLSVAGEIKAVGGIVINTISDPVISSVTSANGASTTYTYKIVFRDQNGKTTAASNLGTTTTGAVTLDATHTNTINFSNPEGTGAAYVDIYRVSGGTTQGKITSVGQQSYNVTSLIDHGEAADGTTAPTINTTGTLGVGTLRPSGALDITSTTQPMYPPRMTTTQRDAMTVTAGATIYCTDCTANDASTGVMETWNGSAWKNYW